MGRRLRGSRNCAVPAGQAWGVVELPPAWDPHGYLVHPALLDACLQVTAAALDDMPDQSWLPLRVRRYRLMRADEPITQLHVHAVTHRSPEGSSVLVDIMATDTEGEVRPCRWTSLQLRRIERKASRPVAPATPTAPVVRAAAGIAAEIMGLPEGDRQGRMLTYIRERVAQILDSKVNDVPVDRPLDTLGAGLADGL